MLESHRTRRRSSIFLNGICHLTVFLVSYDLQGQRHGFDYRALLGALQRLDAVQTQWSSWYVAADASEVDLFNYLTQYVHSRDQVTVVPVTRKPIWGNAFHGTRDFIARFFP